MNTNVNLLQVSNLRKIYAQPGWRRAHGSVPALDGVSFTVPENRTVALVGKSGCGKTTLAMCLAGLERPDEGQILFRGRDLVGVASQSPAALQREIQLIFQDSAGALNPRMCAQEIVEEPLRIRGENHARKRAEIALAALAKVGLSLQWRHRLPHQFSGGQRQRLAIARALVLTPRLLILDEALSGLDLSMQAQIVNLLSDLQMSDGVNCLYISHDVRLVSEFAGEIAVMSQGKILRQAPPAELLTNPQDDYTRALLQPAHALQHMATGAGG